MTHIAALAGRLTALTFSTTPDDMNIATLSIVDKQGIIHNAVGFHDSLVRTLQKSDFDAVLWVRGIFAGDIIILTYLDVLMPGLPGAQMPQADDVATKGKELAIDTLSQDPSGSEVQALADLQKDFSREVKRSFLLKRKEQLKSSTKLKKSV